MRMKFTINEILFELYLLFSVLGGILRSVLGVWEVEFDTYSFVSKGRFGTLFLSLSFIILFILLLRCSIRYLKQLPTVLQLLTYVILIYYLIWIIISLRDNSIQSVFLEGISTSIILLPLICTIGYDQKIWNILEKMLPFFNILFCSVFFCSVFLFWSQYGLQWPTNATYKNIFSYWITSMWLMAFVYINEKKKRKLLYSMVFLIIAAAFITQSRAWVLQTSILLFVIFLFLGKRNRCFKFFLGCLIVFIAVIGISYVFPDVVGNLFERGLEDTRSGQYIVFFAQHSWTDLIFGLGLNATYSYLGNTFYQYFDNQFMFILFHYGMLPVISWFIVFFILFKGKKIQNMKDSIIIRAAKFTGIFVLLAYLGVSTYYQIEIGYSSVLIMILFGNAIKRKQLRRT